MEIDVKIIDKNLMDDWGAMEDWSDGTSSAPTGWTLTGAGASVAQESSTVKIGQYSAALTRSGADCSIYYDFGNYDDCLGKRMTFGAWVYVGTASRARLSIDDGVGSSNSSYHTGAAGWEFLTVTHDVDESATQIRVACEVNTGNVTAYFDGGVLVVGEDAFLNFTGDYTIQEFTPVRRTRVPIFSIPRRQGVLTPEQSFEQMDLRITGSVIGSTVTAARDNTDSLTRAFQGGEKDFYIYNDRFLRARTLNFDIKPEAQQFFYGFNARMVSGVAFWRYVQKSRKKQVISSSPTTFTLTVNGNVATYPVITISADQGSNLATITLENVTGQESFSHSNQVDSGDDYVIDTENLTVTNAGTDEIQYFTGSFFQLLPGQNTIKYTGSNCTIKIDWWDQWL